MLVPDLRWRSIACAAVGSAVLLGGCAQSPSVMDGRSPTADRVATLAWVLFGIALVVFIIVTALLILAYVRSRRTTSTEIVRDSDDRRPLTMVLFAGAVVPAVVLFGMMVWSISLDQPVSASGDDGLVVEVIGHRWWWEVRYPHESVVTANEIHIPTGRPISVKLTSDDVIHSFWVPQLAPKLDLIPGQTNTIHLQTNDAGEYRGQCAEYCGLQHAHMEFLVIADEPDTFNRWMAQQQQPAPDPDAGLVLEGQQAFLGSACVYCHTIRGTNASGTLGPDLTHIASRLTIGAGVLDNTRGNLAGWIVNSQAIKPGNLMPPMDLDPDQVQAILAYLETLE